MSSRCQDIPVAMIFANTAISPLCLCETATRTGRKEPIPNLYGAGEVTGGVHGGNRLAGNSLLECAVCLFASPSEPFCSAATWS